MTLDTQAGGVHGRRPSFKGLTYTRIHRGQEVQSAWPRKRGSKLHPKTKAQMEWFRQIQWAFKFQLPLLQKAFAAAVAGTPLMPRDIYAMVQAGRFCDILRQDGKRIYPMSGIRDVSASLDFLSQFPGSLIARGAELWEPILAPDEAGWILTSTGPDTPPLWLPPQAAGIKTQYANNLSTGAYSNNSACKGILLEPDQDIIVHATTYGVSQVSGASYRSAIYRLATLTIDATEAESDAFVAPSTGLAVQRFHYPSPVLLLANTRYAITHRRTDATGTTTDGARLGTSGPVGIPMQQHDAKLILAQANPVAGQAFTSVAAPIQIGISFAMEA